MSDNCWPGDRQWAVIAPLLPMVPAGPVRQDYVSERTNCRLKDFRAIATRYDKLARNFLASLCLVTALLYWCD